MWHPGLIRGHHLLTRPPAPPPASSGPTSIPPRTSSVPPPLPLVPVGGTCSTAHQPSASRPPPTADLLLSPPARWPALLGGRPSSVPGDASVPCLAPLVLLLLKKEPTCDRPSCVCGDASVPCLASPVLLLIIKKPACGRPVCPWGRVCPLSCLSRPLINNKKPCLRPACLSVGDASVPRLASLVLLSIRRSPPCGGPILAGRVRPLSCFLRLLIKALLGGNASVPWLAFSSFCS